MTEEIERPKIGICICIRRGRKVLVHKRKGKHAPGTWAFPGGHLEMWEDLERTALREAMEEAGSELQFTPPKFWTIANTRFRDEGKHYVVIFFVADWIAGEPQVMEEEKCECWEWHDWDNLPNPLMQGLQNLKDRGMNPLDAEPSISHFVDFQGILDTLQALYEEMAASDPYPTSDEHPVYRARQILQDLGRIPRK